MLYKYAKYAAAGAVAVLAGCGKPPAEKSPVVPVQVSAVSQISAPLTMSANGVVEPLQTVSIQAQVGGTLDTVAFHEGDDVTEGQLLFRLDPRPFQAALRQATATLDRDRAQLISAQNDATRYKALAEKDYVTKSQADQAVAAAAAMQASVEADSAAVDNARLNLNYTTIKAPIAGRTGRLLVRQGNVVRANVDQLVVINQLHPILVRFPVVQQDFPSLQRRFAAGNVPVRATTADSTRVDEVGSLSFLDNAVDSLTGTVTAKARFENRTNTLWPGEYVRLAVELQVENNATAVPSRAVMPGQTGSYVFVVGADKTAKVRPVTPGRIVGEYTLITNGVSPGEQVVVDGQSRLAPNARVDAKVVGSSSDGPAGVPARTAEAQKAP